jgi:hypothetical protein
LRWREGLAPRLRFQIGAYVALGEKPREPVIASLRLKPRSSCSWSIRLECVMGLYNKFENHLADKYASTQIQGMKLADDLTKNSSTPVKIVGLIVGIIGSTAVGVARVWNPMDIADSLLTPDDEMEERLNKKMKYIRNP